MPLVLKELWKSRSVSVSSQDATETLAWIAIGSTDETEVYAGVLATAPVTYNGLVRAAIDISPLGGGVWEVSVKYGPINPEEAAGVEPSTTVTTPTDSDDLGVGFSADISANTVHITQSISTRHSVKAGGGVPDDFKKAIGVTKDSIEGCDIFAGTLELSLTVPRANVRLPYMRTLKGIVGKTNNAAWYGFSRGEVLYLGATVNYTGNGFTPKFSVTHKLAVGEVQVDIDVGNGITVPTKFPFDYLWCGYVDKDIGGGHVFPVPDAAYVEQVHDEADFMLLEIGG